MYPLMIDLSNEYKKINKDIEFDISAGGAGKGMTDAISGLVDLGMISREIHEQETEKGIFHIPIARDAVIPVVNSKNPLLQKLKSSGLNKTQFLNIFIDGKTTKWETLYSSDTESTQINVYTRSDACGAADVWALYLGKKQEDLLGTGVFGDPGLAEAVSRDINGIGYNNINFAYDNKTNLMRDGLSPVPIDLNNNGKIDEDENFYGSLSDMVKAIADNKYPSPPSRNLYLVSFGKPDKQIVKDFLIWILNNGEEAVKSAGYINLPKNENLKSLELLTK